MTFCYDPWSLNSLSQLNPCQTWTTFYIRPREQGCFHPRRFFTISGQMFMLENWNIACLTFESKQTLWHPHPFNFGRVGSLAYDVTRKPLHGLNTSRPGNAVNPDECVQGRCDFKKVRNRRGPTTLSAYVANRVRRGLKQYERLSVLLFFCPHRDSK